MYRQTVPDIRLSVELATDSVPDDGNYHVVLDGQVVFTSSSKARALGHYTRLRDAALASRPSSSRDVELANARRRARALDEFRLTTSKGVRSKLRVPSRRGHR